MEYVRTWYKTTPSFIITRLAGEYPPSTLLLRPHTLIPPPLPTSPGILHLRHIIDIVQSRIVHPLAPQFGEPALPLPKHRLPIAPKVLAVCNHPPRERVSPCPPLRAPPLSVGPVERNRDKGIQPEEPLPLLPDAVFWLWPLGRIRRVGPGPEAVGRRAACGTGARGTACDVLRGVACGDEARDRLRRSVRVEMSAHGLVGGEIARDLEELDAEQHRDPGELEGGPDGEHDGEGVLVETFAEVGGEDVARWGWGRCGEKREVCPGEAQPEQDTQGEEEDVEDEVAVIVVCDAVVYPGAVAGHHLASCSFCVGRGDLLIALCYAALAALTVFAAQGLSCHAIYAEVVFVELARLYQFVDEGFGRAPAGRLGYEAGVGGHGEEVEVGDEAV